MLNPFYLFAWHEKKKVKITHNATSKAEKKRKKKRTLRWCDDCTQKKDSLPCRKKAICDNIAVYDMMVQIKICQNLAN